MKNLCIIAFAVLTIGASAQERQNEGQRKKMRERMEMRQTMTPEETAILQSKNMTLHLDLTKAQQTEIEKILQEDGKIRAAKREEFKKIKGNLEGQKLSKDDRFKMANDRLDHRIDVKKKMKNVLNAEQYKKFEKMQEKRQSLRRDAYPRQAKK